MLHQVIETLSARVALRNRYDNFIGGQVGSAGRRSVLRQYQPDHRQDLLPGRPLQAADIELALDAAHKAKDAWGNAAPAKRAEILNKIADRMEENLEVPRRGRDYRQRQADPRDDLRRHPARHRSFPLFRRLASALRKARCRRSTTTRSPTTSMSPSAWSARSSRGTSRS